MLFKLEYTKKNVVSSDMSLAQPAPVQKQSAKSLEAITLNHFDVKLLDTNELYFVRLIVRGSE